MRRTFASSILATALLISMAACSSEDSGTVEVNDETVILDVRTPAEYSEGHLDGAQLLDFNAGDVAAAIPDLDPNAEYLVYCRSGNRAGQTTDLMEEGGFSDVTNLGSLEEASEATGISIVD